MRDTIGTFFVALHFLLMWAMPTIIYIYTIYAAYKMFMDNILAGVIAAFLPFLSTIIMFILQLLNFGFIGYCSNICIMVGIYVVCQVVGFGVAALADRF